MKYIWTLAALCLIGCATVAPPGDKLSAMQARPALADFVATNPKVFVSPGQTESVADILKEGQPKR